MYFLIFLFIFSTGILSDEPVVLLNGIFQSPVSKDFIIHPGEDFCDEMYYHSYKTRNFHTAEDYILKWKGNPIKSGTENLKELKKLQSKIFGYLPENASFALNSDEYIKFLRINLYRADEKIIDTGLGLYPRSANDKVYGFNFPAFLIYDGTVEAIADPDEPKGWGKAVLIRHDAPKNKVFLIKWNEQDYLLREFWSQYSHLNKNSLRLHQKVKRGEIAGYIGDGNGIFNTISGKQTIREGAHLHFEIRIQEAPIFYKTGSLKTLSDVNAIYIKPSYFIKKAKLIDK